MCVCVCVCVCVFAVVVVLPSEICACPVCIGIDLKLCTILSVFGKMRFLGKS